MSANVDASGWARSHGGVDISMVIAQVVLIGNRKEAGRILDMRAIKRCGPALSGTIIDNPSAGEEDTVRLAFDLDSPDSPARTWSGWGSGFGGNYFDSKTVSLKYKEQQTLQILGITETQYCEFHVQLKVFTGKKTETLTIRNGDQPFKVSARLMPADGNFKPFSRYQRAYIGGVNNPNGRGAFIEVDPARFESGDLQ